MPAINEKFIDDCRKANPRAQKQLFELLFAPMYRVCLRYTNHKEDAEDCVMKGFLKAFQNMHRLSYTGEGSARGWIRRIVVNECLMFLRKKSDLLFYPEDYQEESSLPPDVLLKIDAEALNSFVMQLPVGYRTIFNLFAVEGYTHKEISELLGISENTSKSQFCKAKMKLKQMLEIRKSNHYGKLGE